MPHTERELEACYAQMLCVGLSGMSGITLGGGGGGIAFDIVTEDNEPIVTEDDEHIVYNFQVFSLSAYHYGSYVQVYWPLTPLADVYELSSSPDGLAWTVLDNALTDGEYTDNSPPGATAYYRVRPFDDVLSWGDYVEAQAFSPNQISGNVLWLDADQGTYTKSYAAGFTAASSQYLSVASNSTLQTGDVDFWCAGWVYFTTSATMLFANRWVANNLEYTLWLDSGRIKFSVSANGTSIATTATADTFGAISTGTWYFVMGHHDSVGNTISVTVNTATDSAAHATGVFTGTGAFELGRNPVPGNYLNGRLDSVAFGKSPPGGIAGIITDLQSRLYNNGVSLAYADLTTQEKTDWGLVSWWDLDEATGATRNDSHGTNHLTDNNNVARVADGVNFVETTTDGATVARWNDLSGEGNHLSQATLGARPTLQTNELNSLPVLRFDGSDDYLETVSGLGFSGDAAFTVVCVLRQSSTTAQCAWSFGDPVVNGGAAALFGDADYFGGGQNDKYSVAFANSCNYNTDADLVTSAFATVTVRKSPGAINATTTLYRGGVLASDAGGSSTVTPDLADLPLDLGRFGSDGGGYIGDYMAFDLAALLVYDSALSNSDRTKVENYLAAKYGLTNITNFSATNNGIGAVSLSWTAVPYASNYTVQRSLDDTTWTTIKELNNTTTYEDTGLADNTTYYYRVRAGGNSHGEWWGWTASESITTLTSPDNISGLVLWLDANHDTYQSTGGAVAIADGDPVGEWQDQSGQGNHATQATGGKKPTLQTGVLNGRSVVRFDGIDDFLAVATAFPRPLTLAGVVLDRNTANIGTYVDGSNGAGGGNVARLFNYSSLEVFSNSYLVASGTVPAVSQLLFAVGFGAAGSFVRYGGVAQTIAAEAAGDAQSLVLAAFGSETETFKDCDWAELVAYDSLLSAGDCESLESYFTAKYGL